MDAKHVLPSHLIAANHAKMAIIYKKRTLYVLNVQMSVLLVIL